ncbi:WD40 repeat domain-containing protein [Pseudobacteriovorax antillogorgiicola]|uniref:WD40 repeat n=1 Tax=Pseudobacteriovorax antillogorgiicola TaxID=1513793 RepID=A0A1Y6BZK5_9BACT|nr:WD40 repeat domain-containing protein [Pseudobacteriovorax antillogorgiicola]TCS52406.1 WD40 repeat protein [Pseudobacteriovorax antillogorgiicola]SMF28907.1 WD40 repeat [Pseudobacteriovorax antillogorgiicola]
MYERKTAGRFKLYLDLNLGLIALILSACSPLTNHFENLQLKCGNVAPEKSYVKVSSADDTSPISLSAYVINQKGKFEPAKVTEKSCVEFSDSDTALIVADNNREFGATVNLENTDQTFLELSLKDFRGKPPVLACPTQTAARAFTTKDFFKVADTYGLVGLKVDISADSPEQVFEVLLDENTREEGYTLNSAGPFQLQEGQYKLRLKALNLFKDGLLEEIECNVIVDQVSPKIEIVDPGSSYDLQNGFQVAVDQANLEIEVSDENPYRIFYCIQELLESESPGGSENCIFQESSKQTIQIDSPGYKQLFTFAMDRAGNKSEIREQRILVIDQKEVEFIQQLALLGSEQAKKPKTYMEGVRKILEAEMRRKTLASQLERDLAENHSKLAMMSLGYSQSVSNQSRLPYYPWRAEYTADGEHVVVITQGKGLIVVYSKSGEMLWQSDEIGSEIDYMWMIGDSNRILISTRLGGLQLWSIKTKSILKRWDLEEPIWKASINPSKSKVGVAGITSMAWTIDLSTFETQALKAHSGQIRGIAWLDDENLITGTINGEVLISNRGEVIDEIDLPGGDNGVFSLKRLGNSLAISSFLNEPEQTISAVDKSRISFWSLTGELVYDAGLVPSIALEITTDTNENHLALDTTGQGAHIIPNWKAMIEKKVLAKDTLYNISPNQQSYGTSWIPGSSNFISLPEDFESFVQVNGIYPGNVGYIRNLKHQHSRPLNSLSFSPDGKRFITTSNDKLVNFHSIETSLADQVYLPGHYFFHTEPNDFNEESLLTLSYDTANGGIFLSTFNKNKLDYSIPVSIWTAEQLSTFRWVDSNTIVGTESQDNQGSRQVSLIKYRVDQGTKEVLLDYGSTTITTFHLSGNLVFIGDTDGYVKKVNLSNNESVELARLDVGTTLSSKDKEIGERVVRWIQYDPKNDRLYAGGFDKAIYLVEGAKTKQPNVRVKKNAHSSVINDALLAETILYTAGRDQEVKAWNSSDLSFTTIYSGHVGGVRAISLAQRQKIGLSVSTDATLQAWNPFSGKKFLDILEVQKGTNSINAVKVSLQDYIVVGGSVDTVHFSMKTRNLFLRGCQFFEVFLRVNHKDLSNFCVEY